ncbi:hypothetical protein [Herbiconiux sp. UC225_62]|uniref:hypothetical protein n=1 Tax=Herbiconiux sp. UC225_62 TaxID=3350168 RepID=UPI0036D3C237
MTPPARATSTLFVCLLALSIAEVATLGLLLLNLAVLHIRPIAQLIGPVHGAVYLAVVMIAVFAPGLRRRDRALGFVPVVGGALAVWRMRRAVAPPTL